MTAQEVDVLVVGAGPAGLTAAATLARFGVVVQVVERKQRLSTHPRATVVSTRSMELLRSWGLEDEIKAAGMPEVEWLALVTETLADADRGELATLGLPTKEQVAVLSPTAPLCAPQHHTEAVLLAHSRSFGVEVAFGQEVLRVDGGDEGAEALIREGDGTHAVSARYVIGADGAHSIVRSALGIEMAGPGEIDGVSVSVAFRRAALRALPHRPSRHPERLRALGQRRRLGLRDRRGPRGFDRRAGADAPDPDRRRCARPAAADPPCRDVQVRR